jgi:hypothetical protein
MKVLDPIGGFRVLGGTYLLHFCFGISLLFLDDDEETNLEHCGDFHTLITELIVAHWVLAVTNIGSIIMDIKKLLMAANIVRLIGVFWYQYVIFDSFVIYLNAPDSCATTDPNKYYWTYIEMAAYFANMIACMIFLLGSKVGISLENSFIKSQQDSEIRMETGDWMKEADLFLRLFIKYPTLFIISLVIQNIEGGIDCSE